MENEEITEVAAGTEKAGQESTIAQVVTEVAGKDLLREKEPDKPRSKPAGKAKELDDELFAERKAKRDFLKQYIEHYPDNKVFHVTSDNMVFLEKDLNLARLHQRSLETGSVTSININK